VILQAMAQRYTALPNVQIVGYMIFFPTGHDPVNDLVAHGDVQNPPKE
jgi:hypothetical protein